MTPFTQPFGVAGSNFGVAGSSFGVAGRGCKGLQEGVAGRGLQEQGYGKGLQEGGCRSRVTGRGCRKGVAGAGLQEGVAGAGLQGAPPRPRAPEVLVPKTTFARRKSFGFHGCEAKNTIFFRRHK